MPVTPAEPLLETPASVAARALASLPPSELSTQRIIKLHYQGPDGDGTLNLVLRLERPDRFSLQGNDRLGRSWFRLAVSGPEALYLDLREDTFCRFRRAIEIAAVPLGPLPFDQLPALLLGRLPVAAPRVVATQDGTVALMDQVGRRWTVTEASSGIGRWTLWNGDEPAVWWFRDGELAYLSSRADGLQLRWRLGRSRALTRPPDPLEVPASFEPAADCDEVGGPG